MPAPLPPERVADIRTLFFTRLAETNRKLILALADLAPYFNSRNHNAALAVLAEVENRIQAMRTILIVFRECLEG